MEHKQSSILKKLIIAVIISLVMLPVVIAAANPTVGKTIYVPVVNQEPPYPANTYFISPNGNDSNSGKTEAQAWKTFNRAWQSLYPGYTLVLLDGVYHQTLRPNVRNGEAGKPITIKAKTDGKAIIDGDYVRTPIQLGDTWPGPIGNYFVIEGIVARNAEEYVIAIVSAHHNIFRRVSAYNANTDTNSAVIGILWPDAQYNLLEDVVAAGTGRKVVYVYQGSNNTIRRTLAYWKQWDGRMWHDSWPWGDNIQLYNASYNIIENSIGYGPSPYWSISIQANDDAATCIGNKILGSIAVGAGMNTNGTVKDWGTTRPQPTDYTYLTDFDNWPGLRSGFMVYGQGTIRDNVFRDIFARNNAGLGFANVRPFGPGPQNSIIDHATILGNGLDAPFTDGGVGSDVVLSQIQEFTVTNSKIEGTSYNGSGARLTNRYVGGVLTTTPLWPWPMEGRIITELGFSVTNTILPMIP
jgi:hypothetical protein